MRRGRCLGDGKGGWPRGSLGTRGARASWAGSPAQGIESQCGPAPGLPPWEALTQIRPGQAVSGTRPRHMASCKVDHKVARRPAVHTNHRDLDGGRMAAPVTLEQTFSSTIGTLAFRPTAEPPGRGTGRGGWGPMADSTAKAEEALKQNPSRAGPRGPRGNPEPVHGAASWRG